MPTKAIVKSVEILSCSNSWRNYFFCKITTECGIRGYSEFDENFGSPGVGFVIGQMAGRVIGQSAHLHEHIYQDLRCVTRPGSGGVVGQAIAAIENALIDIKAKALDVPVYMLLGGKVRDEVRVYWSHFVGYRTRTEHFENGITDASGTRQIASEVVPKGYTALKTNLFRYEGDERRIAGWSPGFGRPHAPARNAERNILRGLREHLEMIRDGVGPDVDILLDLNFNARTEGYLKIIREIADLDIFWIEIDTPNPDALAYIRSQSPHPISGCETLIGLNQFIPFFEKQALDVAIIDVPWNGIWQSMKIAAAAEAYEINVAPHNFYGHLCSMMSAHFSAAVPNLRIMETDVDRVAWDSEIFTHVPEIRNGHLVIPDRPGWGIEPDEEAMKSYPPLDTVGMAKRTAAPRLAF